MDTFTQKSVKLKIPAAHHKPYPSCYLFSVQSDKIPTSLLHEHEKFLYNCLYKVNNRSEHYQSIDGYGFALLGVSIESDCSSVWKKHSESHLQAHLKLVEIVRSIKAHHGKKSRVRTHKALTLHTKTGQKTPVFYMIMGIKWLASLLHHQEQAKQNGDLYATSSYTHLLQNLGLHKKGNAFNNRLLAVCHQMAKASDYQPSFCFEFKDGKVMSAYTPVALPMGEDEHLPVAASKQKAKPQTPVGEKAVSDKAEKPTTTERPKVQQPASAKTNEVKAEPVVPATKVEPKVATKVENPKPAVATNTQAEKKKDNQTSFPNIPHFF
ncbi:hypothetical protein ACFBZI_11515 [Moraxella sp. ZJ142]|uniref:hypothetical protein n=1 Tax=Moraxella marmotae TaxID=3344520 RepID=UPI0035D40132